MTADNELICSAAAAADASLVAGNDGITTLASERTTEWCLSVSVEHLGANVL